MSERSSVFGIWNDKDKRFVFGIREPTEWVARAKFRQAAGKASYCWRYSVRRIPDGWRNPPNPAKY